MPSKTVPNVVRVERPRTASPSEIREVFSKLSDRILAEERNRASPKHKSEAS